MGLGLRGMIDEGFSEETKLAVWNKAKISPNHPSNMYRIDACGALIRWGHYGDTTEKGYGWEIDHIVPTSKGGSNDLSNLQALQWQNNRKKGDKYPILPADYQAVYMG